MSKAIVFKEKDKKLKTRIQEVISTIYHKTR